MGRVAKSGSKFVGGIVLIRFTTVNARNLPSIPAAMYDEGPAEIFPGVFEYRRDDSRLFVVQTIGGPAQIGTNTTKYLLAVVLAPGMTADDRTELQKISTEIGAAVAKAWPIAIASDGSWQSPALELDLTNAGTAAKGAWPAGWRLLLATDIATVEGTLPTPTGPRIIGNILA